MTKRFRGALAAVAISLAATDAQAFDFGFVRAPDYLDPYFLALIVALIPAWLLVLMTKPRGVPFNQLYRTRLGFFPALAFRLLQLLFLALVVLLFLGMGLARA